MSDRTIMRITCLEFGLFGDVKPASDGVSELQMDFGAGYRVYFKRHGHTAPLMTAKEQRTISRFQ